MTFNIWSYYCLGLFISLLYLINFRLASISFFLLFGVLLIFLPSTGFDYFYYKIDYESAYLASQPPFIFTESELTAELFYKIYSGFIRIVTGFDYSAFLSINFIVCAALYFNSIKSSCLANSQVFTYVAWLFFLPVAAPTLFYFSPRSSISFFIILSGFFSIIKDERWIASALFLLGCSIHSQYIPISLFLMFCNLTLSKMIYTQNDNAFRWLCFYGIGLAAVLIMLPDFLSLVTVILSFLPTHEVAQSKLHYFNSGNSGIRLTSFLSIVVFPVLGYLLIKNKYTFIDAFNIPKDKGWSFIFYLSAAVVFGISVNIAYFDAPHLSGRLGRFSDYLSLIFLIPTTLMLFISNRAVCIIGFLFMLASPFLYPTLYSIV